MNKTLNPKKETQCPYCGYYTTEPRCKNCNHMINKLDRPSKSSGILGFVHAVPGGIKSFKWDDTFVKTNLVIIVGIMGTVSILMLIMNNL